MSAHISLEAVEGLARVVACHLVCPFCQLAQQVIHVLAHNHVGEVCAVKNGLGVETCAAHDGARYVGLRQVGALQVGLAKVGQREVGARKVGVCQVGTKQRHIGQVGLAEVGTLQAALGVELSA
eukprot:365800-Chlamydomonas_euryale.AAC.24